MNVAITFTPNPRSSLGINTPTRPKSLILLAALATVTSFACDSTRPPPNSGPPIHQMTKQQIETFLDDLSSSSLTLPDRVCLVARRTIGQPYKLGLLGEGGIEPYDPDPLYCLTASDCVTLVEQTYALALAHDWPSFLNILRKIRYRNARIGILTRNHFTEADWNPNNAWLFDDITQALAPSAAREMTVRIDRKAFFAKYGLGKNLKPQTINTSYLPTGAIPGALTRLQPADVVEFVHGPESAPYISHMGLIATDDDGQILLIHSGNPAVAQLSLTEYLSNHPKFIGLKFLRPKPSPVPTP